MTGYGYSYGGYSSSNGLRPRTEDWSYKTSYGPSYVPNQNAGQYYNATKTEAGYDHSPLLTEYRQTSPERSRRPSSQQEYFLPDGQKEASRPDRYRPVNSSYRNQTPNSYQVDTTGDLRSTEWNKPNGNMMNNGVSDEYCRKSERETKPEIINSGGWPRPNKAMWETPPETSLRKPTATSDVGKALEFMKQAAKVAGVDSSNSRYAIPASAASRTNGKAGTVEGNEGQRKHGNLNFLSRAKEVCTGINGMKTAAKK